MQVVYYPQAFPSKRFSTIKECRAFMNSGIIPWHNFQTIIGCFIVRENKVTGQITLFSHLFPWQLRNLRKNNRLIKNRCLYV